MIGVRFTAVFSESAAVLSADCGNVVAANLKSEGEKLAVIVSRTFSELTKNSPSLEARY